MFRAKKIIIADDHPLFRDALHQAVEQSLGDIMVVDADSFSSLQRVIRHHDDSDLILLDLHMPGSAGFSALNYLGLQCPHIPVTVVSASEDMSTIARAIDYGAAGFIPKSTQLTVIVEAIKDILAGNVWLPEGVQEKIRNIDLEAGDFNLKISNLTPKQFRVLMMLIEGGLNKQIADELNVSEATVKAHLTEIFKKLGVSN